MNLQNLNELFYCINCTSSIFPFNSLTENEFFLYALKQQRLVNGSNIDIQVSNNNVIFNQLNSFILNEISSSLNLESNDESDKNILNCNYFSIDDFLKSKFPKKDSFSVFHLNIHSVNKNLEDLKILFGMLDYKFDIIALTESKIKKDTVPIIDMNIPGYHPPLGQSTEANKGGVLLYISEKLSYKVRPDLQLYKSKRNRISFGIIT